MLEVFNFLFLSQATFLNFSSFSYLQLFFFIIFHLIFHVCVLCFFMFLRGSSSINTKTSNKKFSTEKYLLQFYHLSFTKKKFLNLFMSRIHQFHHFFTFSFFCTALNTTNTILIYLSPFLCVFNTLSKSSFFNIKDFHSQISRNLLNNHHPRLHFPLLHCSRTFYVSFSYLMKTSSMAL